MTPVPGTIVVALGGNALAPSGDRADIATQFRHTRESLDAVVALARDGWHIAIVHGNGPQVGNIMIQVEEAITKIPPQSLDVAVAQTQGSMGYMLANQLRNRFNEEQLDKEIAAVLTEVVVDREDPAFDNPSKPVGPYFTAYRANLLMQELGWQMVEDAGRGWRKVVASPMPKGILGSQLLKRLVENGAVLVAGGGGGIPVYRDVGGYYRGVEAVIDKDYVASILARELAADLFIVLTQVPMVAEHFGRPNQRWLRRLPVRYAKELLAANQFPPGSMGPKIQASIQFVEATGKEVLITDEESLKRALEGKAGTFLAADGDVEYAGLA